MNKIIAQGAEAVIEKQRSSIIKRRVIKGYRFPQLDEKLRRLRTRTEARLMEKVSHLVPSAKVLNVNEQTKEIELQFVKGKKLADALDKIKNPAVIAKQIGRHISKLHNAEIIHGDLTTSNMIYNITTKKIHIIDFGLGFQSSRVEDKAVDLHVLKEALEARHPKVWQQVWKSILSGYKTSKNSREVLKRLEKVESRGRYKEQY
jgi:Kae1-associated kinase Bud32